MKTSRITKYDPTLTVEENAANNNVTTATMRSYIQSRGIDRATDKQIFLYNKVKDYAHRHPKDKAPQIATALGLTANTVRKYLRMKQAPQAKDKKTSAINQVNQKIHFLSVSDSQTDILKSILAIHLPHRSNFQCDLTAWKLGFYKDGLSAPTQCFDKYADRLGNRVTPLSELDTIFSDGSFDSIVVDLPCSVEMPSTKSRFDVSTKFSSLCELFEEHEKMLLLAYRKLWIDGVLIYKVMDFTFFGKPYWLSDMVLDLAKQIGFTLIDKYIYIDPKHSKIDRRRTKYAAAVPAHSYFFVFRKERK